MDLPKAHQHFSTNYFNRSWDLMDKSERTPEEDEDMLFLSIASHYHWKEREDYDKEKASVGYWHTSRAYALLDEGENAKQYAEKCLSVSSEDDVDPFYVAYAYEALARAYSVLGQSDLKESAQLKAREAQKKVSSQEYRESIERDLETI